VNVSGADIYETPYLKTTNCNKFQLIFTSTVPSIRQFKAVRLFANLGILWWQPLAPSSTTSLRPPPPPPNIFSSSTSSRLPVTKHIFNCKFFSAANFPQLQTSLNCKLPSTANFPQLQTSLNRKLLYPISVHHHLAFRGRQSTIERSQWIPRTRTQ